MKDRTEDRRAWPFPEEGEQCEDLLDFAVESTFPASDPVSVDVGYQAERRRDRARLTCVR